MFLIVGLGNPGSKYARTRHNVGFDVVEILADKLNVRLTKLKCKALLAETKIGEERVVLAQPQTFMNLSGESVVELMNWYKVPVENLIVCYDDIDIDLGALRVRAKGSAGTHNGMRSIIYLLGKDNFPRVRVGIGKPAPGWDLVDHVLAGYQTPRERELAFGGYMDAADTIIELVKKGPEAAMRLATERTNLRYPKPEKPKKEKDGRDKADFAAIGRHTWDRIRANALNGAACCVTVEGKNIYQGIFGSADIEKGVKLKKDTLYRLASMTKPVTAVAVMIMAERGKIDLDAPVSDILPEFAGQKLLSGEAPSRGITARDLLTHSSGLCQDETAEMIVDVFKSLVPDRVTLKNMVRGYAALPLAFEPRTKTSYSALAGFDVLARMVEVVSNMKFEEFVKLAIFEPLKMNDTSWYPTDAQWERTATPYAAENGTLTPVDMGKHNFGAFPASYTSGAAGLLGTLGDYSRFAQMLLNEGELDGARILEADTVRQMKTVQLFRETTENVGETETWGLGMRVITKTTDAQPVTVGSFGWSGAYGTHFWVDPEKKLTAVYMSNMTTAQGSGADTAREFERDVYSALNK